MRRRITLYIDGLRADLNEQTFVLMNYAQEDFSNPAAIVNSSSKQITLPGTPANDRILGHPDRVDRTPVEGTTGRTGIYFSPGRRTPFAIYSEEGAILEAGYLKLDRVDRTGKDHSYVVTLYGDLGSFLYSLSYTPDGEKRTLASLDYLGTGDSATELDFIINAATVQAAWDELAQVQPAGKWGVINFAPCYNGTPSGGFSADKGIFSPADCGLPSSVGGYTTLPGGYALATLPRKCSEWEVKDLRSYLQRPVVNVKKVLAAIADPDNNGGWAVDLSVLENADYEWGKIWMTLPMLPSLGTYKQIVGSLSATFVSTGSAGPTIGTYSIAGTAAIPIGSALHANINVRPIADNGSFTGAVLSQDLRGDNYSLAFVQLVALDGYGNALGGSEVHCLYAGPDAPRFANVKAVAAAFGYVPDYVSGNVWNGSLFEDGWALTPGSATYQTSLPFALDIADGASLATIEVRMRAYKFHQPAGEPIETITGGTDAKITLDNGSTNRVAVTMRSTSGAVGDSYTYTTPDTLRSNAKITKAMLLGTAFTPAEFLTSFCKTFGLFLVADPASKSVAVMDRATFYDGALADIDLTRRVDVSTVRILPTAIDSRWWEFRHETVGGEFVEEYQAISGRTYAAARVNTGYEFNAEVKDVMERVVFKAAASVLERSPLFYSFEDGATVYPTPFVLAGNKYTLWNSAGETSEHEISAIEDSVVSMATPINQYNHEGFDNEWAWKAQLHDKDGKAVDGSGVLLFYNGDDSYDGFHLSDDLAVMVTANGGTPCWLLDYNPLDVQAVPAFSRYLITPYRWDVQQSLEFGVPSELDIPYIDLDQDVTIYAKRWAAYLGDRLDSATKVLQCRADLRGIDAREAFRHLYWFDGSLWALSKITNHSLTTWDLTECEFVQVQDPDNYRNGQN